MNAWLAFLRTHKRFLSFGVTVNLCLAVGQTYFVSLFNSDIQAAFDLNHGQMAMLYGAATMIGSLGIAPAGRLLDAMDLRTYLALVLICTAASCALMGSATIVPLLFLGMVGVRFFAGCVMGVMAQATMARYFDAARGRAAAVANIGYMLGYAVFPFACTALIAAVGWRESWLFFAGTFVLLVLPLTLFQLRGHGERHTRYLNHLAELQSLGRADSRHHFTLGEVLRDSRFYMVIPGLLAVPTILFTFQYHQLELVHEKGWDVKTFAAAYLVFSGVAFVANVIGGAIVDRWGSRRLMAIYLWPMIPALALLAWADGAWSIPFYMMASGITFGFHLVISITLWSELYGTRFIGAIRGFNASLNTIVASISMALSGWLIDRDVVMATQAAFSLILLGIAAVLLLNVARRLPARR